MVVRGIDQCEADVLTCLFFTLPSNMSALENKQSKFPKMSDFNFWEQNIFF